MRILCLEDSWNHIGNLCAQEERDEKAKKAMLLQGDNMKFGDVASLVQGEALFEADMSNVIIDHAYAADLLSDVLALTEETTTLITGTISLQVMRVAEILNVIAIIFVRGKHPSKQVIDYAQRLGIPILTTRKTMFETCGLLYANGVRPCKNRTASDT